MVLRLPQIKKYYNGEIPFLSINDITNKGKYVRYTENHLSQSGLENSSAWVVPKYSLIMSMYASCWLGNYIMKYLLQQARQCLQCN